MQKRAPKVYYGVNRVEGNRGYYLSYDIYLKWAIFVKRITIPQDKRKSFSQHQGARNDIEQILVILHLDISSSPILICDIM